MDEQTGLAQNLFDILTIVFEDGVVFEKMGGETLDGDRFVGEKCVVDGKGADFFFGPGEFAGEIESGGGNPGRNDGSVVDALGGFVGGKRKQPFVTFDAKIAIPAVGQFEGKGGIDEQIGGHFWSGWFFWFGYFREKEPGG